MLHTYFPVLLLLGFVILNAVLMLGLSHLTLRPRPTPVKSTPYESGMINEDFIESVTPDKVPEILAGLA